MSGDPPNPLQVGLQNLARWFDSLPKPQIRLPGRGRAEQHSTTTTSDRQTSLETESSTSDGIVSGRERYSVSYTAKKDQHPALNSLRVGPVDKDDLGRATWTFLHVLAAQMPDHPTKSQQKDVHTLVRVAARSVRAT